MICASVIINKYLLVHIFCLQRFSFIFEPTVILTSHCTIDSKIDDNR